MKEGYRKILIAIVTGIVIVLLLRQLGVGKYLTLEQLQQDSVILKKFVTQHYLGTVLLYILIYSVIIASALPAVAPLTLLGGFLFGVLPGTVYSVVAATLGSWMTFFVVQHFLRNVLASRYKDKLERFQEAIGHYGFSYLLTLQFLTIIPFFVINTLAALANVPLIHFLWTTVIGSIPLLFIYSLAGRQLGELESIRDILRPHIIGILLLLALIALLPIIIRKVRAQKEW